MAYLSKASNVVQEKYFLYDVTSFSVATNSVGANESASLSALSDGSRVAAELTGGRAPGVSGSRAARGFCH